MIIGTTKADMSIGIIFTSEIEATGTEAIGSGASELDQGIIGTQRITMNTVTTILDFGIKRKLIMNETPLPQLHKHPNLPNLPFSRQIADPAILSALGKITATLAHIEFFLVEIAANTKPK